MRMNTKEHKKYFVKIEEYIPPIQFCKFCKIVIDKNKPHTCKKLKSSETQQE